MNISNYIKNTLEPLGVPVSFQTYSGKANTYITYFCYNELGEVFAENKEIVTGYYVQVDFWSDSNYYQISDDVKTIMINAGFKRTSSVDLYEKETKIFHKAMRFKYVK